MENEFRDIKCNFNLYRSFYAVAITGSFSEAARLLYVSQPSLSYNVKQLEEQLNTDLFYRRAKGVVLTFEGESLLKHIDSAFSSIIEAEKLLEKISDIHSGSLTIGAPSFIIGSYVNALIEKIMINNPSIHLKIIEKSSNSLKELLIKEQLDVIIDLSININDNPNIETKIILEEKCCFAGIEPIISKCENIKLLCQQDFILPSVGANLRKICDEYFDKYLIKVIPKIETYTTETTLSLVEKGLGVGVFYQNTIENLLKNKVLYKYEDKNEIPTIPLCYAYNLKNSNPILQEFLILLNRGEFDER